MASPMTVHGRVSKMDTMAGKPNPPERKDSKWEILTNLDSGTLYRIILQSRHVMLQAMGGPGGRILESRLNSGESLWNFNLTELSI